MNPMRVNITTLHDSGWPLFPLTSAKERLEMVEQLRIESGKFLYEYPAGLQRVLTAVRRKDKASPERLQ
jgi:hypothetical protein